MKSILLASVVALFGSAAVAEPVCGPRDSGVDYLIENYQESAKYTGLAGQSGEYLMEMWVNEDTGTWTFATTTADGTICFHASGNFFGPASATPEVPQGDLN